jgi:hypothetical protein
MRKTAQFFTFDKLKKLSESSDLKEHLVQQEIDMFARLGDTVTQSDFDWIANRRGFNQQEKERLYKGLLDQGLVQFDLPVRSILSFRDCHFLKSAAFDVTIGSKGLKNSWQTPFPETTKCCDCGGESRIGFVVHEDFGIEEDAGQTDSQFVSDLHQNDPNGEGYWLHDVCAVAVYFCKRCLNPTALYNQG